MKLSSFSHDNKTYEILYVETQQVKEGVSCDVYTFKDDESRDLAIVRVSQGFSTPRQEVLLGDTTIEGYFKGAGILTVETGNSSSKTYSFSKENPGEVKVDVGEIMQWHANAGVDLTFYEICSPPYKDGRFKNL